VLAMVGNGAERFCPRVEALFTPLPTLRRR
jgi:hypothetical protein